MDYAKALLVYQLSRDYHAIVPDLRALRDDAPDDDPQTQAAIIEGHRFRATGWFNQVFVLWINKLIDQDVLTAVCSAAAAKLWVEHVGPLDRKIRLLKGDIRPFGDHPIEQFWIAYAKGDLLAPAEQEPSTQTPKEQTH